MTTGDGRDRQVDTDAQWARELARRVSKLEQSRTIRIGRWVISERDGELVGTTPGRPAVVLTGPAAGLSDTGKDRVYRVLTMMGGPTSGTWGLGFRSDYISGLAINATAISIQNALVALQPKYTALDFNVSGSNGGPWTVVTPAGALITDNIALVGGTSPYVDVQPLG